MTQAPVEGPCVVDASTVLKWVLQEDGSDRAAALLDGRTLRAPALLFTEVANALWSASRRGRLTPDEASDTLDLILRAPLLVEARDSGLHVRAMQLAHLLGHPVYDCVYLALGMAHGVPVVTADQRFVTAAARLPEAAPLVRHLDGSRG